MVNTEFRARPPKREPDYRFRVVYCGTPDCAVMYNVQLNRKSDAFISASTYLKAGDKAQVIVPRCIKCGANLGDAWLAECYTDKPETQRVHGRNDDERADLNGPVL